MTRWVGGSMAPRRKHNRTGYVSRVETTRIVGTSGSESPKENNAAGLEKNLGRSTRVVYYGLRNDCRLVPLRANF